MVKSKENTNEYLVENNWKVYKDWFESLRINNDHCWGITIDTLLKVLLNLGKVNILVLKNLRLVIFLVFLI